MQIDVPYNITLEIHKFLGKNFFSYIPYITIFNLMSKQIHFGDEARLQMFVGMEKVAKVVSATIGPK